MTAIAREQQRLIALAKSGLTSLESIGVFDNTAAEIILGLQTAIGVVSLVDRDSVHYKGVALASHAKGCFLETEQVFSRTQTPCSIVVEIGEVVCVSDLATDPRWRQHPIINNGVRAYLGLPLRNLEGECLGVVAAIDLAPRHFNNRDLQFMQLLVRNLALELERVQSVDFLAATASQTPYFPQLGGDSDSKNYHSSEQEVGFERARVNLLDRLVQDLRTPLTSVLGMTRVLNQEIYGPLRRKQKEYLNIVYESGQQMLSVLDTLIALQDLKSCEELHPITLPLNTFCQQLVSHLELEAERRSCRLQVSIDLSETMWALDRNILEQALYHLLFRMVQTADEGCTIRLHIGTHPSVLTATAQSLRFEVWIAHPWLGESLPSADLQLYDITSSEETTADFGELTQTTPIEQQLLAQEVEILPYLESSPNSTRSHLGLLLSSYLVKLHGGKAIVSGSEHSGYRYILTIPSRSGTVS